MTINNDLERVGELAREAFVEGNISQTTLEILKRDEIAKQLPDGLGRESASGEDVLVVTVLVDDSNSISQRKAAQSIREGHQRLIGLLGESPNRANIFICTRFLNNGVLNRYCRVERAPTLNHENYSESRFGGTPLFHEAILTLGTAMFEVQRLEKEGARVRSITLLMSDGENYSRLSATASDVACASADLKMSEKHLLAAYAVTDDEHLIREFLDMGIERKWIVKSPDALKTLIEFAELAAEVAQLGKHEFKQLLAGPGFGG